MRDDSDASRIRNGLAPAQLEETLGNELVVTDELRSDFYEALSRDLAPIEAVNGNTIPSVTLFQTCGIGNGTERGVEVRALGGERQPQKVALVRALPEAVVREIGDQVCCEVQNADGLFRAGISGAIPIVE